MFLKYSTAKTRFPFSSPSAEGMEMHPHMCFFQQAPSLRAAFPRQEKFQRGQGPQSSACTPPYGVRERRVSTRDRVFPAAFPLLLASTSLFWVGEVAYARSQKGKGFFFPSIFPYLSQNRSAYSSHLTFGLAAKAADCIQHPGLSPLNTQRRSALDGFFVPRTMLK